MIDSQTVKKAAKQFGADLVGIASLDRFDGSPKQNDPRYIFPEAKALIVFAYRMPRGVFRGIEEGTFFTPYPSLGYAGINLIYAPMTLWNVGKLIEDEGYDAVPIANINGGEAVNINTGNFKTNWSVAVSEDKPYPDIMVNFRIAAFCAGLGQFGYSRIFLTPEFGPMQRFNLMLTDAPLEPDPLYSGPPICDHCKLCVKNCPGGLLDKNPTRLTIAGKEIEFAGLDNDRCLDGINGNVKSGGSPFIQKFPQFYGYGSSVEAGKGCIRACYAHLEEKDVLTKKFHSKFRKKPLWKLNPGEIKPLSQHVIEDYVEKGRTEEIPEVNPENSPKAKPPNSHLSNPWG
ncbi:(4Fe-4S)-binding protein [Spirochaetia bacterium]|nr:(4Fe-4S)-binding protein [Spirochaetia bacterium]